MASVPFVGTIESDDEVGQIDEEAETDEEEEVSKSSSYGIQIISVYNSYYLHCYLKSFTSVVAHGAGAYLRFL